MLDDQSIKKRILDKSLEMFQDFGYSKVTMEEIANNLGISKKTLYKHFTNKEHILRDLVETVKCDVEEKFEKIFADEASDFIEKLQMILDLIGDNVRKMQGHFVHDIIKNHPEIWKNIQEFRKKKSQAKFTKLIELGIKEGFIKADINSHITMLVYTAAIHEIMVPEVLAQIPLSANQVYSEIVKILFEGILSEKGRFRYVNLQLTAKDKTEVI
ncbi:MAG: TetR/AcrR family transcriptional regulator [Ignavibacteriaceae bacterium]|nr:TetR/AcrR family transcriptional regulator [Ignavibacteriaceae bacterium]